MLKPLLLSRLTPRHIIVPIIAGALASVHATLPYAVSLAFFALAGMMFARLSKRNH